MVAEGFYHTRNRKKYIGRLYVWSVIMMIGNTFIQRLVHHPNDIAIINNIFATMFLITIYLQGIEFIRRYKLEKEFKFMFYGLLLIIGPLIIGGILLVTLAFFTYDFNTNSYDFYSYTIFGRRWSGLDCIGNNNIFV